MFMRIKKLSFLLVVALGLLTGSFAEENDSDQKEKSSSDLDVYVLKTGMDLTFLKINDYTYFAILDPRATVLEITPIEDTICKMVVAVPWNRAGSFQNYVIYLKTGDLITMRTGSQTAVGLVGNFGYNKIPFVGIAK